MLSLPRWAADVAAYAFYVLLTAALAGALAPAARRAPRWLWLAPLLLFAAVVFAGSEIRYRAPVEPFLALLAALAVTKQSDTAPGAARGALEMLRHPVAHRRRHQEHRITTSTAEPRTRPQGTRAGRTIPLPRQP
jgi:hypothetical protein